MDAPESVFFLFGFEGLLLQFAGLDGGVHARAVLLQGDVGVADVEERGVSQLLQLRFELALGQRGASVIGLRGAVAQRQIKIQRREVIGKLIGENLILGGAEALLRSSHDRCVDGLLEDGRLHAARLR